MGKRLATINRKKREAKKREEQAQLERGSMKQGPIGTFTSGVNQYYGLGAILALGVISGLGYYIYRSKKGQVNMPCNPTISQPLPRP